MYMKRVLSVFLVVAMVMSLAACGSGKVRITTQESSKNAEASAAESVSSESEDAKVSQESELESDAENVSESTPSVEDAFEEVLAVDNDQCTIKITGIDSDDIWGYTLKTYMENKSSDKTYMFSVESASINGVKAEPGLRLKLLPEKSRMKRFIFRRIYLTGKVSRRKALVILRIFGFRL
jgi:predicted small lipoprotein YifL